MSESATVVLDQASTEADQLCPDFDDRRQTLYEER
jgi:hypothetical protein